MSVIIFEMNGTDPMRPSGFPSGPPELHAIATRPSASMHIIPTVSEHIFKY